ncbi:MAG TPA: hypothetical protein PKV73_03350 [Agriterribacter sp.]|nr:hypothetical protein [Chitinophagaceae bacterium]HRP30892.1 hypothetical protein [Agriterribacter sp.]
MKYVLYILLGYLLFRFITRFLFPVYKTGRHIKRQFDDMQQRMQENMRQQSSSTPPPPQNTSSSKPEGEYIEFEEVK